MTKTKTNMYGVFFPDITVGKLLGSLNLDVPQRREGTIQFKYSETETIQIPTGANIKVRKLEKFIARNSIPDIEILWRSRIDLRDATLVFKSQFAMGFGFNTVKMKPVRGKTIGLPEHGEGIQVLVGRKSTDPSPVVDKRRFSEMLAECTNRTGFTGFKLSCYQIEEKKSVCVVSKD